MRSRSLACGGRKSELAVPGVKGVGERGKRIRRSAARGLKECEANARTTEDAGLEMMDVQMTKPLEFSQGTENQLVIRLREPTL